MWIRYRLGIQNKERTWLKRTALKAPRSERRDWRVSLSALTAEFLGEKSVNPL